MAFGISASGPLWAAQPVNDRKQQAASIRIHALFRVTVASSAQIAGACASLIDYYK